ncbi:FUSC family protein [Oerskovia enterophila]
MTARRIALALVLVAPAVGLLLSPWRPDGTLVYLGMLPAGLGLLVDRRAALTASLLTPASMLAATALRDLPLGAALFMLVLGAAVGLSAAVGWHGIGSLVGPLAAFALLGTPLVALPSGTVSAVSSPAAVATMTGLVAFGGLWTTFVGGVLARNVRGIGPRPVPRPASAYFGLTLGILAGLITYTVDDWTDARNRWWLLLTVFVMIQPYFTGTLRRAGSRVVDVLAGTVLAAVVAHTLDELPVVLVLVALALTGCAVRAVLRSPFWVVPLFLTPAVVLLTSGGEDVLVAANVEHAVFIVAASLATVPILVMGRRIMAVKEPNTS